MMKMECSDTPFFSFYPIFLIIPPDASTNKPICPPTQGIPPFSEKVPFLPPDRKSRAQYPLRRQLSASLKTTEVIPNPTPGHFKR